MKRFLLLVISCMLCNIVFAQGSVIDRELQEVMKQRSDEKISIDIILKSQVDGAALSKKAARSHDKEVKRSIVVNELKRHAESTQADVMAILEAEERSGRVTDIRNIWIANTINCEATKEVIYKLSTHPDIAVIGYEKEVQLITPEMMQEMAEAEATMTRGLAHHVVTVNADDVWARGYTGKNVVVAVLDSGTNFEHKDIKNQLWEGYVDGELVNGWDVISNTSNIKDGYFHGTHCAGIVCGDGTSGTTTGIAPDARLMTVRIVGNMGTGSVTNMLDGVQFALENGADILSMSLGFKNNQITVAQKETIRATFDNLLTSGVIVCAAAGNDGTSWGAPHNVDYPAACPSPWRNPDQTLQGGISSVICVGAYDLFESSSQGPSSWEGTYYDDYPYNNGESMGLIRPDISAPGNIVYSLKYNSNNEYHLASGTSQATPCVAGVIALMLEKNANLTPAEITKIIETTASNKPQTKNNVVGSGRIDALAAIEAIKATTPTPFIKFESATKKNNNTISITVRNEGDGATAANTTAVLSLTNNPYITISQSEITIGEIAAGSSKEFTFNISLAQNTPLGHTASFNLTTNSGDLSWKDKFSLKITEAPSLTFQSVSPSEINVGEDKVIEVSLLNKGTVAMNGTATFTLHATQYDLGYVSIVDGEDVITDVGAGETVTASFTVNAGSQTSHNYKVDFFMGSSIEQNTPASYIYEFENDNQGWTCFDAANNNVATPWWHSNNAVEHGKEAKDSYSDNGHLMSETVFNNTEYENPIDNYLVSPSKIEVTANSKITFYARAHHEAYYSEHFGLAVSENSNTTASDFTLLKEWTIAKNNGKNWVRYEYDLSSYAGKEIYVAIRHFFTQTQWNDTEFADNGRNVEALNIDDIVLENVIIDIQHEPTYSQSDPNYFNITVKKTINLPAPMNFTATTAEGSEAYSQISLQWDAVNMAKSYEIFRNGERIATVTSTSYTNTGLTHGTTYKYKVRAIHDDIVGTFTNEIEATTSQKTYSATITAVSPQTFDIDGETTIPLTLRIKNDGSKEFLARPSYTLSSENTYVTIANNSDLIKVLEPDESVEKTINVTVSENIPNGSIISFNLNISPNVDSTDPVYFSFDIPFEVSVNNPFRAPKNLEPKNPGANFIPLVWDVVPNATSYDIYRDDVKIANTSFTMYVDNGLEKETTYCYKVKSVKANEVSDFSEEVCATTLAEDNGIVVKSSNLIENSEYATLAVTFENKTGAATIDATRATLITEDPYVTIINGTATLGSIAANGTATAEFTVKIDITTPENHAIYFNVAIETEGIVDYIQYTFDSGFDDWEIYSWNTSDYEWEYDSDYDCITSYSYKDKSRDVDNLICSPVKIKMTEESQIVWDVASSYSGTNTYYKEYYEVYITTIDPEGTSGWDKEPNELGTPIHQETLAEKHKNYNWVSTTPNAYSPAANDVWVVFRHDCKGQDRILVDNIKITNVLSTVTYYNSINVISAAPKQVELTTEANGIDKVDLSWSKIARAQYYSIYRDNKYITNTTATSFTDNGLVHNTAYCYKVAAVCDGIEYSHSEETCITTNQKDYSVIFEATPQEIDVLGLTTATISFTIFNDGANEIKGDYILTCEDENVTVPSDLGYIEVKPNAETTKTIDVKIDKNVTDGSVIAFNLNLSSQNYSLDNPFEIKVNNPSRVPENLIVSSSTDAYSLTLSWNAVEGATSYNIYRGGELVSNTSSTNYIDKGLNAGTEYCYQVTSMIGAVESDFSNDACATTSTIDGQAIVIVKSYEITENGNIVTLTATLINNSSEATPEGTTATLSCNNDQYVTVTSATAEVGPLAIGATKEVTFTMEFANNTPSNYELDLDVIVEYTGSTIDLTYNFNESGEDWYCLDWNGTAPNRYHGWEYENGQFRSYSHKTNDDGSGLVLSPDNLLLSPQSMSITTSSKLKFNVSSPSTSGYHYEHYGIFVTETYPDDGWSYLTPNSITLVFQETLNTHNVQNKEIDLSTYAGKNIWIIFRHWNCTNQFAIDIDNVEITNVSSGGAAGFAHKSSLTATVNKSLNMFTGTGSWATASNWSKGSVPTSTDDVIIKGNATIESGNVTVNSLVIYNENSLTINEDAKLTVNNSFVNTDADALIINDGAQLVQNSENVKATFNMGIANPTAWTSENIDGWQFAASPLTDAMLAHFANANDEYCDLFVYDGSKENEWLNYKQNTYEDFSSGNFEVGTGYLLSHKDKKNAALKGTLNNASSYSWNATFTENADNGNLANFHLLGNPFSFDMNWSNVNVSNMVNGFAVLNANGSGYNYLSSGTIPVGDAFFVKASAANPSISYGASRGERDKDEEVESINLVATGNAGSDNVIISLSGAENEGFNKLENFNKDIASIFIDRNGRRYGIANFDSDVNVVNVAFNAKHIGNYTISAQPQGEFESIILVDRFTGIETNLLLEDYNFTATSSDNHDRFIVKMVNGQQTTDNSHFAYVCGEDLIIEAEGSIQIIDMMGRVVYSSDAACHVNSNAACHVNRINVSGFENAVYVIRVVNENGVKTQKVVIN